MPGNSSNIKTKPPQTESSVEKTQHLSGTATQATTNLDSTIGRLVVERGFASPEELQDCLSQRQSGESTMSLSQLLVANGVVTEKQLKRISPSKEKDGMPQQIPGYSLQKKLGAGAMATVYLAKQLSLDRLVALKILPKRYSNNTEWVERFYAEGRAAAKLNHPNIVGALDVGQAGEFHYFVMEYVDGETAYDALREHGPYSEKNAIKLMIEVCRALEHAHAAGIIHRDVKPKNIMITRDLIGKLADMGLARTVSDREAAEAEAGKAFGTPYYISPEQIRGQKDIDFRADVYSFGATFYHLLTGKVPFEAPNPSAVMQQHLTADLVAPDHIRTELSSGISEIIEVCMSKRRSDRYKTTSDLLTDLEAVARGDAPAQARKSINPEFLSILDKANEKEVARQEAEKAEARAQAEAEAKAIVDPMAHRVAIILAVGGWTVAAAISILFFYVTLNS